MPTLPAHAAMDQFAQTRDRQPVHAFTGSHRQVQLADRLVQHGLFSFAELLRRHVTAFGGRALFERLADAQVLRGQDNLDLVERRFAEVLAAQELLFAAACQVAQRADVHLLQAIAAADR